MIHYTADFTQFKQIICRRKNGPAGAGPKKTNQQPVPQIWLRICQMEPQPETGLQTELQEKKNILPTSFSEFVSRGQEEY